MIAKLNHESTIDSPLRYFEYFFLREGFKVFQNEFYESARYLHEFLLTVNKEFEFIEVGNGNDQGIGVQRIYFSKELEKHLNFQRINSFYLINKVVDSFSEDKQIVLYLKKTLGSLHLISNKILKDDCAKYPMLFECIYGLVTQIYEKYILFFDGIQPTIVLDAYKYIPKENLHEVHKKIPNETSKIGSINIELNNPVVTFKWKNDKLRYFFVFFSLLLSENYIPRDSVTQGNFFKAFGGVVIDTQLGIKWKLAQKQKGSVSSIIRVIKLLMNELHLIDKVENNGMLVKMIEAIFLDSEGRKLENLDVLVSQHSEEGNSIVENGLIKDIRNMMLERL